MKTEKEIEAYLVGAVRAMGGIAYKFTSPAHRGVSDRLVVLPGGRVWFVEVKTKSGYLSPLQRVFRDDMSLMGCNYCCLYGKADVDNWVVYVKGGEK
jgi:hypothetical protein